MRTARILAGVAGVAAAGLVGLVPADGVAAAPVRVGRDAPPVDSDGVWVVRPSGDVEQVLRVAPRGSVGGVKPSPSHRRLAVRHSTSEGGGGELSVIDLATSGIRRPLRGVDVRNYEWSGDNHLILSVVPSRLERLDLSTGKRTTIWNADDAVQNFVVSPDGREIVLRRECPCDEMGVTSHSLFAVRSDGTNPRRLISPLHRYDNAEGMVFAPDSRRVAVLAGGQRSIVDVGTGAVTVLAKSPQYYPDEPKPVSPNAYQQDTVLGWSPDSDWVAFSHPHLGAAVYRSDGSSVVEGLSPYGLAFGPNHQLAHLDGDTLVKSELPERRGLALLHRAAAPLWPTGGDVYAVAPTGVASDSHHHGLWRVADDGRPSLIARVPAPQPEGAPTAHLGRSTIRLDRSEEAADGVVEQREQVFVFLRGRR